MSEPKRTMAIIVALWNHELLVGNGVACFKHQNEWLQVGNCYTVGEGGERDEAILRFFDDAPSELRIDDPLRKDAILEAMAAGRVIEG